ncbi:hypothetical protein DM02DRAFT_651280 [Periconia macrospinosa]|uniref:NACHT-NTPase and P-loop NTPases N-terminal domain-containing protein n=1 Tax=Periconia macrospinosa TaxID=97972 RepID=A0A2V1E3W4_9PLEO|nr:hypothetical protein DM02DRAFT_651280 [Periconia macrospinosa]
MVLTGLETVAAVSSFVQLIDVAAKVASRLNEYRGKSGELPRSFLEISLLLPAFIEVVRETKVAVDDNRLSDTARQAITPLLKECSTQISFLDRIVTELLPKNDETSIELFRKVVRSLKYDKKIHRAEEAIRKYLTMISHQGIASARNKDAATPAPPKPTFVNRPFHRDTDHVHRDALDQIITQTHKPNGTQRLALVGLGGVGKSQIAIEYAYRTRDVFADAWAFWVNATSATNLENDFRKIAQALRLPGWDERATHILKIVYEWLCDEANGRWVMIIDNADDISVFTAPPPVGPGASQVQTGPHSVTPQIRDFLPKSSLGTILITSRAKDVAFELTGNANYYIHVQEMTEEESMKLLNVKLRGTHAESDKLELVKLLGYMPLAISQAAAYISQRAPLVTVSSYIEDLKKGNQNTTKLLSSSMTESHREIRRSHSIIATWHLTFEYVRGFHPSAARLLSLMCLFYWQEIRKSLLVGNYEEEMKKQKHEERRLRVRLRELWGYISNTLRLRNNSHHKQSQPRNTLPTFFDDCVTLINFSLLKVSANGQGFQLHRLVHLATEKWLDINHELDYWSKKYVRLLETTYPQITYPEPGFSDWQEYQTLFSHAIRAIECMPSDKTTLYVWLRLMLRVASFAKHGGLYTEAESFSRIAIHYLEQLVGPENEHTLQGVHELGEILNLQGNYQESEIAWRRAWSGRQRLLGTHHNDTTWSAMSLARVLFSQGKAEEAMAIEKIYAGKISPDTPKYLLQMLEGNYAEAESNIRQSLRARQEPWNEDAVEDIEALADMLAVQAKYREATGLLRAALAIQVRSSLATQDAIKTTKAKLASTLACHGHYREAEELLRQLTAEPLNSTTNSNQQELFAHNLECLGAVLAKQGLFAEAEKIGKQAVEIGEKTLGLEDIQTRNAMHSLAETMRLKGQYEDALALYEKSHLTPGKERFSESNMSDLRWMAECVDDIREVVRTEGKDESCWERMKRDDRSFLLIFFV